MKTVTIIDRVYSKNWKYMSTNNLIVLMWTLQFNKRQNVWGDEIVNYGEGF
jgi:hypothetical protein